MDLITEDLVTKVLDHTQDEKHRGKKDYNARNRSTFSAVPAAYGKHDRNSNLSLRNHNKESTRLPTAPGSAYHRSHPFCFISLSFVNIGSKISINGRRRSHWTNRQLVPCCLRSVASGAIYSPVNETSSQPRLLKYLSQVDDHRAAPHPSSSTFFGWGGGE